MARQRQRQFARRPQRTTNWARFLNTSQSVVPAATKLLIGTMVLSNPGIGETVRRVRGRFLVMSDQTSAYEFQLGAFGMVIANDLALAAGAASLPGPGTDGNDDGWFVWEPFGQLAQATEAGSTHDGIHVGHDFDSKGMRRIEEGFGIALMVENVHATHALEFVLTLSLLSSRIG